MPSEDSSRSKLKSAASSEIDRNTTLCLACSSSLPPLKALLSPSTASSFKGDSISNGIHMTNCCQRPICPSCTTSNPRLTRYDPCLACLGGVGAVNSQTTTPLPKSPFLKIDTPTAPDRNLNLDGSVRDEDTFVLGDDEDEDEELDERLPNDLPVDSNPPPPYDLTTPYEFKQPNSITESLNVVQNPSLAATTYQNPAPIAEPSPKPPSLSEPSTGPCKYYLKKSDTLTGICLRFSVNSHEICKLNNLPTSVMRTTPHLLHTRAFLLLPPNPKTLHYATQANDAEEKERIKRREEKLVRERAERRVQTLMKEADWWIAKAYVALADDADEREMHHSKLKEMGPSTARLTRPAASEANGAAGSSGAASELEILAVERYLDDDEWEAEERRAGRRPEAISFTLGMTVGSSKGATSSWNGRGSDEKGRWWRRSPKH